MSPGFEVCCCFPFGLQCIILVLSLLFVFMASSASFHHLLQRYPPTLLCQDSSLPTFIGSWANLLNIHHTTPLHSCPLIHDFVKHKFLCLPFNALLNLMPTKISHFPLFLFSSIFLKKLPYSTVENTHDWAYMGRVSVLVPLQSGRPCHNLLLWFLIDCVYGQWVGVKDPKVPLCFQN